ncbi:OmpH family outer membrane protein [Pseudogemmobacter sonorensis]|uniref:OmpH family outer membrane protein n=1 Tax=Pseudogemmobacter sonorensis TaxID=2989681 RepID=UPI003675E416
MTAATTGLAGSSRGGLSRLRPGLCALALCALLPAGAAPPAAAQEADAPEAGSRPLPEGAPETSPAPGPVSGPEIRLQSSPFVLVDQDRLFGLSDFGRAFIARQEAAEAALLAENARIESELEAEERALTQRRAVLSPAEFAPLAAAFDSKVEEIRAAQEEKVQAIRRMRDEDQRRFFEAVTPILYELMIESGAVAILVDEAVVMSLSLIDITDPAITRVNQRLPVLPETDPEPETETGTEGGAEGEAGEGGESTGAPQDAPDASPPEANPPDATSPGPPPETP